MPDLPARFTAVVAGDGSLVPPPEVRAALVPGQSVNVHVDAPVTATVEPDDRENLLASIRRVGSIARYNGPPIPVEELSVRTLGEPSNDP